MLAQHGRWPGLSAVDKGAQAGSLMPCRWESGMKGLAINSVANSVNRMTDEM